MSGRVSRPVRIFSPIIAQAGRLWRAVPTCSIEVPLFRLVAAPAALGNPWRFLSQFQISNQINARFAAEFLKCGDRESHDIEITAFDAVYEE